MSRDIMMSLLDKALAENHQPAATWIQEGYARLRVNGLIINAEYVEGQGSLYLYCSLGLLPQDVPAQLYEAVLEANLLGTGTGGGHIGLHAATRILTYSLSMDESRLQSREMGNALMLFSQTVLCWMEKVRVLLQSQSQQPQPDDAPLFSEPMLGGIIWG